MEKKFRLLKAEEIEVKVKQATEKGAVARTMAGTPRSGKNTLLMPASMRRPLPPPKITA